MSCRLLLAAGALAAALLVGCASPDPVEQEAARLRAEREQFLEALRAPAPRTVDTCRSVKPLSTTLTASQVPFLCEALARTVTIPDLRETGWSLSGVDIGRESMEAGHAAIPITIRIEKYN